MTPSNVYLLRCAFLSVGLTLFCLRILIGRCYRHWVPKKLEICCTVTVRLLKKLLPSNENAERRKSSVSVDDMVLDGPG